ncbi:MAG: LacI family DNA-binding transcriptional regulator [Eubacteriales bacterium]|nr:LacI family DNA-binding transcriptional regulator [Eubacteriales bacterium]
MAITILDIANEAGVSIATVSHVINKTRYVSPELTARIEAIIEQSGYIDKLANKKKKLKIGKQSEIAFIVPNLDSTIYAQLTNILSKGFEEHGFLLTICISNDDLVREQQILIGLTSNKRVSAIVFVPTSEKEIDYKALINSGIPALCLDRSVFSSVIPSIAAENAEAMYLATAHLIRRGHENIALLIEQKSSSTVEERLGGYKRALAESGISFRENLIVRLDQNETNSEQLIRDIYENESPTAFIASGNKLTLILLKALDILGIECPQDLSVVGFGDESWCALAAPPLTTLNQDVELMGQLAIERILQKLNGEAVVPQVERVPIQLMIRKSTQIIGQGPFGEKAVSPDALILTAEEIERLKSGDFKVAISFHFTGTNWSRLHESGIRNTLDKYGVKVLTVTDAHFDPTLQATQLDGIKMQKPDAIIAIPVDDKATAKKFKEISKETLLVFISTIPEGFHKEDYASCISVNEKENGQNAGMILGNYFRNHKKARIGMINHGAPFHGTQLRDMMAEQVIRENYPNIEIVDIQNFYEIDRAYDVCKQMLLNHPEIEGLYISWDRPALEAIRALKEIHRQDVSIVTFDLDLEISKYLANGEMVRGLSTQRPYEQGVAVALATAKALLGNNPYKYIGVEPHQVLPKNLLRAWREINHEPAPEEIEKAIGKIFT